MRINMTGKSVSEVQNVLERLGKRFMCSVSGTVDETVISAE